MEAITRVDWHGEKAKAVVYKASEQFAMSFGLDLQRAAQKIVPHKDGTLEGSATTEVLEDGLGVRVSFGGPAELYAARQHEEMLVHPNGRQWKYLETPAKAMAPLFPKGLELVVQIALKGGS
jgi:hypothetical protein